jgi:hypothetical protein
MMIQKTGILNAVGAEIGVGFDPDRPVLVPPMVLLSMILRVLWFLPR